MYNYVLPFAYDQFLGLSGDKNVKIVIDMYPSKEKWEELGFVFTDIPGDGVLCNATLPEGWSLKEDNSQGG